MKVLVACEESQRRGGKTMDEAKLIKIAPGIGKKLKKILYKCSNCDNIVIIDEDSPLESISEYKYCFNCGAKMEVEK